MNSTVLSEEQIKTIIEDLEGGLRVFYNRENNEIKTAIKVEKNPFSPRELWDDDLFEIEVNYSKYIELRKMTSRDAFKVMEDFIAIISDEPIRERLELALILSKPFKNFKKVMEEVGVSKEEWFAFKERKYADFINAQILAPKNDTSR